MVEMIKEVFDSHDDDGSGSIATDELAELMHEIMGEEADESTVHKARKRMDPSGDGEISWKEFREWFLRDEEEEERKLEEERKAREEERKRNAPKLAEEAARKAAKRLKDRQQRKNHDLLWDFYEKHDASKLSGIKIALEHRDFDPQKLAENLLNE